MNTLVTNRFWRAAVLTLLLAIVAPLHAAVRDQIWQAVIGGKQVQLKLENNIFYLATPEEVSEAKWTYAGTLGDFETGAGGLYVGDLDGSGQTSVAFREPSQGSWYHGVIANGLITFQRVSGEVFQVGQGPTLYPIEGISQSENAGTEKGSAQQRAATAITQPVMATQFTPLASSRHMQTTITLFPSGGLYGYTWVHNGVWLTGYHGQAQVVLLDQYKRPIISFNSPQIGVTGTLWGYPDARVSWQASVESDALAAVRQASIIQYWSPEFDTLLKDAVKWANLVLELAQPLKTIAGFF